MAAWVGGRLWFGSQLRLSAFIEESQEALQVLNTLLGEFHHRTGTAWNPHCAFHFCIGGFVGFDLEVSIRDPCALGFFQLGELVRRHFLFQFGPSRVESCLPLLMSLCDRLTHSRCRSIAVHRSSHSDVNRIFHFAALGFRRRNFYSVKVENYFWGRSAGFMLR